MLWLVGWLVEWLDDFKQKINSENMSNIELLKLQIFLKPSYKHVAYFCSLPKYKIVGSAQEGT